MCDLTTDSIFTCHLCFTLSFARTEKMNSKPNILVFMTDQQRGDSVLHSDIQTPNLDALRGGGVTFTNNYCPSPHCCPSRASFFSALYPTQHGVWNNVCVQNTLSKKLNPNISLYSKYLQKEGYQNYFAGKWHVCFDTGPEDHGFEELLVTCNKETKNDPTNSIMSPDWGTYEKISKQPTTERIAGEIKRAGYPNYVHYGIDENPFNDRGVIESALGKLTQLRNSEGPWSMFVGTLGPHDPYFVPQRFLDKYEKYEVVLSDVHFDEMRDKPFYNRKVKALFDQFSIEEKKEAIRHYMAFCTYEDYLFGLLIEELKQHDDFDNTMVMYVSDHGDYNGEHGIWCKGLPAFKGAYHIPAVVHWPAGINNPGREVDKLISLADFAPTILEVSGTEFETPVIGQSLTQYLYDVETTSDRKFLFTQTNGNEVYSIQRSVFSNEWKLVYNAVDTDELYNLNTDPNEMKNLIELDDLKSVRRELYKKMWQFAAITKDQSLNPYILVGMAEFGPAIAFE